MRAAALLSFLLAVPPAAAETNDDLSGVWSMPGGTRLELQHAGGGRHRVSGTWRSIPAHGLAQLTRRSGPEARLALELTAAGQVSRTVWTAGRDRTRLKRGSWELQREVPLGTIRLKVVTYNIKGIWHLGKVRWRKQDLPGPWDLPIPDVDANDMKALSAWVRAEKPDIVALQEVDRINLPSVDSQAESLAKETGYDYRYAKASLAGLDLPGPVDIGREHGNAILVRRRSGLRLTGSRAHELPNARPDLEKRNALFVGLDVAGVPLRVASTHLTHDDAASRSLQSRKLASLTGEPTLLLGDFNAARGSEELAPLNARCRSAFEEGYAGGPRSTIGPDLARDLRIDQILLCRAGARVLSAWIAGYGGDAIDGFSDHRAVVSVLELPVAQVVAAR